MGRLEGVVVGRPVGYKVGRRVGRVVGMVVGDWVGETVGPCVGNTDAIINDTTVGDVIIDVVYATVHKYHPGFDLDSKGFHRKRCILEQGS